MGTTAPAYPDRYFGGTTPSPVRPSGPNRGSPPIFWILLTILVVLCITWITCWILQTFGLESMLVFFIAISGAIWGWVIRWLYTDKRLTVSHILVIWMVWTGTILSGASYYLAYKGLTANLETLSRYIMVEVVAGVVISSILRMASRSSDSTIWSPIVKVMTEDLMTTRLPTYRYHKNRGC